MMVTAAVDGPGQADLFSGLHIYYDNSVFQNCMQDGYGRCLEECQTQSEFSERLVVF